MKNTLFKFTLILAGVIAIFGLTGCGNGGGNKKKKSKPAVAYMVAHTANAKLINSSVPILQDTMVDCAENYGYTFIVRVDGEPELVSSNNLDIDDQFKNASKERLKTDARNKATNLLQQLDDVKAVHPEVDYLEGLRLSAASLRSLDNSYTSKTIICCGTGLGTTGYLNFKNNLLSTDPKVIVKLLKDRDALPNLKGITVYWVGMGQVEEPQEKLTPKQTKNLQAIWKALVEASGGEFVPNDYITAASKEKKENKLPAVSVVDIPADKPIAFESKFLKTNSDGNAFKDPMVLSEKQIKFVSDKADYLYPKNAIKTIQPIAEYLTNHKSLKLLLVGSTAGDVTDASGIKLSKDRADTVKNTLLKLGADSKQIVTIGMGSGDPWHIKNAGYKGEVASSNRKVVLIDAKTEQAQEILKSQ